MLGVPLTHSCFLVFDVLLRLGLPLASHTILASFSVIQSCVVVMTFCWSSALVAWVVTKPNPWVEQYPQPNSARASSTVAVLTGVGSLSVIAVLVVDSWEGLLRATGGAIEPYKSWWVLIDFVWDVTSHEFKFRSIEDLPGELTVKDHTGTRRALEGIEVDDSNDQPTLGVCLTMTGDLTDQLHHLSDEAETFVLQLQQTMADKKVVLYTYQISSRRRWNTHGSDHSYGKSME
jgi:hypothetical protein